MGFTFVLHRDTGVPLFPVEERPVPARGGGFWRRFSATLPDELIAFALPR